MRTAGTHRFVIWLVRVTTVLLVTSTLLTAGCTSLREYIHNGFKVGPDYCRPNAEVRPSWIDESDPRVESAPVDLSAWWTVFNDPVLDDLVAPADPEELMTLTDPPDREDSLPAGPANNGSSG